MDEIDFAICQILLSNSKTPYRTIADDLRISLPATKKRIQAMQDQGAISLFCANISKAYLGIGEMFISGHSEISDQKKIIKALSRSDRSQAVHFSSRQSSFVSRNIPR